MELIGLRAAELLLVAPGNCWSPVSAVCFRTAQTVPQVGCKPAHLEIAFQGTQKPKLERTSRDTVEQQHNTRENGLRQVA